jgi:peptidyl-prolyl cis-trans isomerase A (cyclophilin A)
MISRRNTALALAGLALAAMVNVASAQGAAPKVKLATSMGDIVVQLDPAKAPKTVENFLAYVQDKHYDGTVFHRVIDGFMIQGGGFTADMAQKPTKAPIPLEASNGLKNDQYTIAMARTGDPHSATAQFFINVVDNAFLNHTAPSGQGWGYAVFGKVVKGQDVVDAIKKVRTTRKGFHDDVPFDAVVIDKAVAL